MVDKLNFCKICKIISVGIVIFTKGSHFNLANNQNVSIISGFVFINNTMNKMKSNTLESIKIKCS